MAEASSDTELYMLEYYAIVIGLTIRSIKKIYWVKYWILMKEKLSHSRVLKELELTTKDWFNYLRMGISAFSLLLEKITPIIQKEGTCMRKAITRAFIKPDLKTDRIFFFTLLFFLFSGL